MLLIQWGGNNDIKCDYMLLVYVEKHAERLRKKYLSFVYELGESQFNGKKISKYFTVSSGMSLWWMSIINEKSFYKSPEIENCIKLLALEEILLFEKPSKVTVHGADSRNVKSVIRKLSRDLSVPIIIERKFCLNFKRMLCKDNLREVFKLLPQPFLGLIWLLRYIARHRVVCSSAYPNFLNNSMLIFSYFIHINERERAAGKFYSEQWGVLPNILQDQGMRINWFHHLIHRAKNNGLDTDVEWIKKINLESDGHYAHYFFGSYLSISVVYRALSNWIKISFNTSLLYGVPKAFTLKDSKINFWPLLKKDWNNSIRGTAAIQNSLYAELFDVIMRKLPKQKLGLYLYEGQGWEKALVYYWRKYNHGKIIAIAHSSIRFWDLRYFHDVRTIKTKEKYSLPQPDCIAVNDCLAWNALLNTGYSCQELAQVEAVRYMNIGDPPRNQVSINFSYNKHIKKLIILGDIMPKSTQLMIKTLEKLPKKVHELFEIFVKPHPGNMIKKSEYPNLDFEIVLNPLHEIIDQFDISYGVNASNANLDAYYAELSVVIHIDQDSFNYSPLRGVNDVGFVSNTEELNTELYKILAGPRYKLKRENTFFLNKDLHMWKKCIENNYNSSSCDDIQLIKKNNNF